MFRTFSDVMPSDNSSPGKALAEAGAMAMSSGSMPVLSDDVDSGLMLQRRTPSMPTATIQGSREREDSRIAGKAAAGWYAGIAGVAAGGRDVVAAPGNRP